MATQGATQRPTQESSDNLVSFEYLGYFMGGLFSGFTAPSYIRIKAAGTIRYLMDDIYHTAVDNSPSNDGLVPFPPRFHPLGFSMIPGREWTIGHLARRESDGKLAIESFDNVQLPSIPQFHPVRIDLDDLGTCIAFSLDSDELQLQDHAHAAVFTGPNHSGLRKYQKVVARWEWSPCNNPYGLPRETEIYGHIDGMDIAPRFLGHVTENTTRCIGLVVEYVPSARRARLDDLEECRAVLAKLHSVGVLYGDLRTDSFLITEEQGGLKKVLMHGFGGSRRTDETDALDREMASMENVLIQGHRSIPVQTEQYH